MNERNIERFINQSFGTSPYAAITSMLIAAERKYHQETTPEERELHRQQRKLRELESIRQSKIRRHICPSCEGKLIRGKKDKKMEYKRAFHCSKCGESHFK